MKDRTTRRIAWIWALLLVAVYRAKSEECLVTGTPGAPSDIPVVVNEVFYEDTRIVDLEFFELYGPANFPLEGLSFIVVDSRRFGQPLNLWYRYDFSPSEFLGCNGYYLVGNSAVSDRKGVTPDAPLSGTWRDGEVITVALVKTSSLADDATAVTGNEIVVDAVGLWAGDDDSPYFYYGAPVLLGFPVGFYRDPVGSSTLIPIIPERGFEEVPTPTASTGDCPLEETVISAIQGDMAYPPPLLGRLVNISAIVTADFQSDGSPDDNIDLHGFYVQEEVADQDNNDDTSEGIFVSDDGMETFVNVSLGDLVRVVGRVYDVDGETQIVPTSIEILETDQSLPPVTSVSLSRSPEATLSSACTWQPDLERYEGMLVEFSERLSLLEMSRLHITNEVKLIAGDRPRQYTQINSVPSVSGNEAHLKDIGKRTIVYDDALEIEHADIDLLQGFGPNFQTATAPRIGDTIRRLQGVLTYRSGLGDGVDTTWRLRRHGAGRDASFSKTNPRPSAPFQGLFSRRRLRTQEEQEEEADLLEELDEEEQDRSLIFLGIREVKIASFNLYNFFTTLQDSGYVAGPGDETPAGAANQDEYDRQLPKIVEAFLEVDADVYALQEVENEFGDVNMDGSFAIGELVKALNDQTSPYTYAYVNPGNETETGFYFGQHAVTNGFIYNNATVFPDGDPQILDQGKDGRFKDEAHKPVLVQSFGKHGRLNRGRCVTVGVVQLASRSGEDCDAAADPDPMDGSGKCDADRSAATDAILNFMAELDSGCKHTLLVGDFNAFAGEQPVSKIVEAGYKNLQSDQSYSYVSEDGQVGTLDYAFVLGAGLFTAKAEIWHINEDEAYALDYRKTGRDPEIFDPLTPARFSDHSPIVVEIRL